MSLPKNEKYIRVKTVCDWIAKGFSNHSLHMLIEDAFGLKSYTTRTQLIKEALSEAYDKVDREMVRRTNAEKLSAIVQSAIEQGKYREAVDAIDKSNRLHGLYTEKHEHTIHDKVIKVKFGE